MLPGSMTAFIRAGSAQVVISDAAPIIRPDATCGSKGLAPVDSRIPLEAEPLTVPAARR